MDTKTVTNEVEKLTEIIAKCDALRARAEKAEAERNAFREWAESQRKDILALRQRAEEAEAERYAYRESYEFQKMVSNALRSRAEKAEAERNALRQDEGDEND